MCESDIINSIVIFLDDDTITLENIHKNVPLINIKNNLDSVNMSITEYTLFLNEKYEVYDKLYVSSPKEFFSDKLKWKSFYNTILRVKKINKLHENIIRS